jgi:hypothetical protein
MLHPHSDVMLRIIDDGGKQPEGGNAGENFTDRGPFAVATPIMFASVAGGGNGSGAEGNRTADGDNFQ